MIDKMEERAGTGGDNLRGIQRRDHGEAVAEQQLSQGLTALGMGESDMLARKSVSMEKQALAWLLKSQTVVTAV